MFQSDNILVIINVVFGPNELMNFDWESMKKWKKERMKGWIKERIKEWIPKYPDLSLLWFSKNKNEDQQK